MTVDERLLQQEYEDALIELQKWFDAVRILSGDDSIDPLAVHRARQAYERARLLWLSCDLRLRSMGIIGPFQFRQAKGILIYSATENVRRSLSDLLRAHTYVPIEIARVDELHASAQDFRFAAVLAYIEPAMRRAPSFVTYLKRVSQPLPLIILPRFSMGTTQADRASIARHGPSLLTTLFPELDSAIRLAAASKREPIKQPIMLAPTDGYVARSAQIDQRGR